MATNSHWCVYMHTSPSGKKYVGITSQRPNDRWRNGLGYKNCPAFYNAIKKYGWENISHEIIAERLSEDAAKKLEVQTIEKYNSNNKVFGYNISSGGDGAAGVSHYGCENPFYGKHHSDKTRSMLSQYRTEYYKTHRHPNCRAILQFDLGGNYIQEFSSACEIEKVLGIAHSVIARVCNGKLNYTHGYIWAYKDAVADIAGYKSVCIEKLLQKHRNVGQGQSKAVLIFNLDGSLLHRYRSAADAARAIGAHRDTVSFSCRNKSVIQKKFRCCYADDEVARNNGQRKNYMGFPKRKGVKRLCLRWSSWESFRRERTESQEPPKYVQQKAWDVRRRIYCRCRQWFLFEFCSR